MAAANLWLAALAAVLGFVLTGAFMVTRVSNSPPRRTSVTATLSREKRDGNRRSAE